ncbi:L,D-transpeptidase family protein [Pedobacter punctiformis]|uniref:L,D-transpeptidase family protein n=1 Tax=Pedobacter punctiformis TaxID=3004097 RepID=A0ABT4L914_9SPHI|nr:L,D-transpeptidase family protein [Pedobacter sp. HCMS5-2]MCZ4244404.1 L,D-transpeptidase family protein [Pedobacter sp. HCMS5-2]
MKNFRFLIIPFILTIAACNWFKTPPEIGKVLSEHFNNKIYKDFDTVAYDSVFVKTMDSLSDGFANPKTIKAFYAANNSAPQMVTRFYANGGLDSLENYLQNSKVHGFNPKIFRTEEIKSLLEELTANKFKKVDESYPVIAKLELLTANAYSNYFNYLNYGIVNPRNIFSRYYIKVKRPDSLSISRLLNSENILDSLKAVQPKSVQYKALQKAYLNATAEEEKRILLLNMERFRWKLPEMGENYVQVNIPDFKLTWLDKLDTVISMKVCVGGKREAGYDEKMKAFAKSGNLDDKPKNHETPLLFSKINSIQANPVWNIPVSIAQSEIYWMARKDPYYLSNSNIKVYYKDKLINEPDTINWSKYSRDKLPFKFKQGSGEGNALGKFKFIFDNSSSIYLHDTNNKNGFNLTNRAISHGCVRIEKPLEFAELLVKDPYTYDKLRAEVDLLPVDSTHMKWYKKRMAQKADTLNTFQLKPAWFGPKKAVPLIITYITAWAQDDKIEYRSDVYGMDEKLWVAMKKFR